MSWMRPTLTLTVADEATLATVARLIARFAVVGDVIRLVGDLGAGKSTFAKYVIQALGHTGDVPSPTYTLVQTYDDTRLPVAHVDCYRLKTPTEMDELGLESYRAGGLILAEWPDKGSALVAADQPDVVPYHINNPDNGGVLTITFRTGDTPTARVLTFNGSTAWQHRYGLFPDGALPVPTSRPVTDANRMAFLTRNNILFTSITPLAPEWSFRSYWRVHLPDTTTRILMDAPPPFEQTAPFANVSAYYQSIGLNVARIHARDDAEGYLLSDDLGDTRLLTLVESNSPHITAWYEVATDALIHLCRNAPPAWGRVYTAKDWWIELARFTDWFMPWVRGCQTTPDERAHFASLWQPFFPTVMALPTGLMPWDYQATNMMIVGDEPILANMGLIDIQDARVAPIAQDLAILLRDIRRQQDDDLENHILTRAATALQLDMTHLRHALDICNLHHCVRIIGGLARSGLRDDKWGGAERFMARTWDVANQSYANPALTAIVTYLKPLEALARTKLTARKNAA